MDVLLSSATLVTLAVGLSIALAVLVSFVRNHGRIAAGLSRELNEERKAREQLGRDLHALIACTRDLGEEVRRSSGRHKSVTEKLNVLTQQMDGTQAVAEAERLMASGVGVEQITRMCALSRGEAALLERWNQRNNAA